VRRERRLWRAFVLALLLALIAVGAWGAATWEMPDWARWTLAGLALALATCLGIAFLVGPAARRLAGERTPLTDVERKQMTANERVEAVNAARQTLIQAVTSLVVVGGVAFTALGLWYTARTVETAQESQITDRYTKAVEQLGSTKQDVRLGGIYALHRLAADSPRDKDTIVNVLAAYVRDHDFCTLAIGQKKLPQICDPTDGNLPAIATRAIPRTRPGADVFAALTIAPVLASDEYGHIVDFSRTRFPHSDLNHMNLGGVVLAQADLRGADLTNADLRGADLTNADLRGADLRGADLRRAHLGLARLNGADLGAALLYDAELSSADLRGANLTAIKGWTAPQIRGTAIIDSKTKLP